MRLRVVAWIAGLSVFGFSSPTWAQFTPMVVTSFDNLDAGTITGFSQVDTFLEGQEGPASLTTLFDRGTFDFTGVQSGDVVGTVQLAVFVDLPFPLPDIDGDILGEIRAISVAPGLLQAEAVGTSVDPALLLFMQGLGFPDPTGLVVADINFEELPGGPGGAEMRVDDTGVLPTSGVATVDIPILWTVIPIFRHDPARGTLTTTTTIVSQTGLSFFTSETFSLNGGADPEFRRADVSGDGTVALGDAIDLLNFLFSPAAPPVLCQKAGDADDSGSLGLADAIFLVNYLFIPGSPTPPAPGPRTCGVDPTPDPLPCGDNGAC